MPKRTTPTDATWIALPGEWITDGLGPTVTALKGLVPTDVAKHSSWAHMLILRLGDGRAMITTPVAGARMDFPPIAGAPTIALPYTSLLALRREDWSQPLRIRVPNDPSRGRVLIEVSERTTISFPMRPVGDSPEGPPLPLFPEETRLPGVLAKWYHECAFVFETDVAKRNAQYRPLLSGLLLSAHTLVATDSKVAVVCPMGEGDPFAPMYIPHALAKVLAGTDPERTQVCLTPNLAWAQVHYTDDYRTCYWQAMPAIEGNVSKSVESTVQTLLAVVETPDGECWSLPTESCIDALSEIAGFSTGEIVLRLRPGACPELLAGEEAEMHARATLAMASLPKWPAVEFGYDTKMLLRMTRYPKATIRVRKDRGTLLVLAAQDEEQSIAYVLAAAVEK